MKKIHFLIVLLTLSLNILGQNSQIKKELAGEIPVTTDNELGTTFNSKMDEVYFGRSVGKWGKESQRGSIYFSKKIRGVWSKPKMVSFSGDFNDSSPHLTRNNKKLYFISDRPDDSGKTSKDIWVTERNKDGVWGKPFNLGREINSDKTEFSPKTTANGDLYFASDRDGGFGQGDIYLAKMEKGKLAKPFNLGEVINSPKGEWNLEIDAQGSILIFEASERKENFSPYGDLYISFRENNKWTVPQNIREINTPGSDLLPFLDEKKNYLYFSSTNLLAGESANLYRVYFRDILKKYKKKTEN
jgi:hypothetical protein